METQGHSPQGANGAAYQFATNGTPPDQDDSSDDDDDDDDDDANTGTPYATAAAAAAPPPDDDGDDSSDDDDDDDFPPANTNTQGAIGTPYATAAAAAAGAPPPDDDGDDSSDEADDDADDDFVPPKENPKDDEPEDDRKLPARGDVRELQKDDRNRATKRKRGRTKQSISESRINQRGGKTLQGKRLKKRKSVVIEGMDSTVFEELCRIPRADLSEEEKFNVIAKLRQTSDPNFEWPIEFPEKPEMDDDFDDFDERSKKTSFRARLMEYNREVKELEIQKEMNAEILKKGVRALDKKIAHRVEKLVDKVYRPRLIQDRRQIDPDDLPEVADEIEDDIPDHLNEMTLEEIRQWQSYKDSLEINDEEEYDKLQKYEEEIEEAAQIRWIPESPVPGRDELIVSHFQVKTAEGNVTPLCDKLWVANWMSVIFYEICKKLPWTWLHIPAGNSRDDLAPTKLLMNVKVHYPQGRRNLCMVKSLASAMFYVGLRHESGMIDSLSKAFENLELKLAFQKLQEAMKMKAPTIGIGVVYNLPWSRRNRRKKKHKRMTLDELVATKTIFPTLIIPRGVDGQVSHAVCVVDDLIFDSSQQYALHLSKESFDWICGERGFRDLYLVVRFKHSYGKKVPQLKREMIDNSNLFN